MMINHSGFTHKKTDSVASIKGHPVHPMIVPIVIGLYVGAAISDVAYRLSDDAFWAQCASWLLLATLAAASFAAVPGLIDLLSIERARALPVAWHHAAGNGMFMIVTALNYACRQPSPYQGSGFGTLLLTLIGLALLAASGWMGGELVYRYGIGVTRQNDAHEPVGKDGESTATREQLAAKFWTRRAIRVSTR